MRSREQVYENMVNTTPYPKLIMKIKELYEHLEEYNQENKELEMKQKCKMIRESDYEEKKYMNKLEIKNIKGDLEGISTALEKYGLEMPKSQYMTGAGKKKTFHEDVDRIARYANDLQSEIPANPYFIAC